MENNVAQYVEQFIGLVKKYLPNDEFVKYLEEYTDYKVAPSSTKYNSAYEGGWCVHNINVLNRLIKLLKCEYGDNFEETYSKETVLKVALLHDLYKLNYYESYIRNVKDENDKWVKVKDWKIKEEVFVYGTPGDNSVRIAEKFYRLTDEEAMAIKYAYGCTDENTKSMIYKVDKLSPLSLLLQTAVTMAICIDEN